MAYQKYHSENEKKHEIGFHIVYSKYKNYLKFNYLLFDVFKYVSNFLWNIINFKYVESLRIHH